MAKMKTPEERAEVIERANRKARKGYKTDLKKRTKVDPEELVVIEDMIVSLRLVGYSNSQCATIVGLSKGQVREITANDAFKRRLQSLRTKLPEAAINLGKAYLVEAVQAVIHVLRTERDNALVLKAAAELFDRFGIPKSTRVESKTESTNTTVSPGTEIPKNIMDKIRMASPEVQEAIAGLNESFVEGVERILGGNSGTEPEA